MNLADFLNVDSDTTVFGYVDILPFDFWMSRVHCSCTPCSISLTGTKSTPIMYSIITFRGLFPHDHWNFQILTNTHQVRQLRCYWVRQYRTSPSQWLLNHVGVHRHWRCLWLISPPGYATLQLWGIWNSTFWLGVENLKNYRQHGKMQSTDYQRQVVKCHLFLILCHF